MQQIRQNNDKHAVEIKVTSYVWAEQWFSGITNPAHFYLG